MNFLNLTLISREKMGPTIFIDISIVEPSWSDINDFFMGMRALTPHMNNQECIKFTGVNDDVF